MIAEGVIEVSFEMTLGDNIAEFYLLSIPWVNTFERDEFEDIWGLF